jgi:hypothetical protein
VSTGLVQLRDDIGDGVADTWDFPEATFTDDLAKRNGKRQQVFCCARIGPCPMGRSASDGGTLGEFSKQTGHGGGIESCHNKPDQMTKGTTFKQVFCS